MANQGTTNQLIEEHITLKDGQQASFGRISSSFPKENRPIIYLPTADFSQKAADEESTIMMIRVIDGLLDKHQNEKGLIHTISYKLAKELLSKSRHHNRLSHTRRQGREQNPWNSSLSQRLP